MTLSDHKFILFALNLTPIRKYTERYKTKNKSFYKFNRLLQLEYDTLFNSLTHVLSPYQLDNWLSKFYEILSGLMNKSFRKGSLSYKPKISWYNSDLKILRNKVNAKYKRTIKNPDNSEYKEIYLQERRNYKKEIK